MHPVTILGAPVSHGAIVFLSFAVLRGRKVFTSPSSERTFLCERPYRWFHISVLKPKAKQRKGSQAAFTAVEPDGTLFIFEPVVC